MSQTNPQTADELEFGARGGDDLSQDVPGHERTVLPRPLVRWANRLWRDRGYVLSLLALLAVALSYAWIHFWVCDDAYISFRYADQLLRGKGLVYNAGEYVEGYTNFLWVIELAGFRLLTGLSFASLSVGLSFALTVGTCGLVVFLAHRRPSLRQHRWVAFVALLLLVTNRNFALFSTSGLETRQFTFLVLLALALVTQKSSSRGFIGASFALTGAALTRPEGQLIWASVMIWVALRRSPTGSASRAAELLAIAVPFVAVVGAHYLFRYSYYGEWLPNTYYAKVLRPWPDAGLIYLGAVFLESGWYAALPFVAMGLFARRLRGESEGAALYACVLIPYLAYVIKVGGDHFAYRPLDFFFPLVALLTAEGVCFFALLVRLLFKKKKWWGARPIEGWMSVTIALVLTAYASVIQVAKYALTYDASFDRGHVEPNITEKRFPGAYILPFTRDLVPLYNRSLEFLLDHAIAVTWREHEQFSVRQQNKFGAYRSKTRRPLPTGAVMAYSFAGILPFSLPELTVIDKNGLTDATVARHGEPPNKDRVMAHDRFPPPGYLEKRGVNLTIEPAATSRGEALTLAPYAAKLDDNLWMPFSTEKRAWAEKAFSSYSLSTRPTWKKKSVTYLEGKKLELQTVLFSFEHAEEKKWKLSGSMSVRSGAVPGQQAITDFVGKSLLGSYAPKDAPLPGDNAHGVALSPPFQAQAGDYLHLLIGGGSDKKVGVELLFDGKSVRVLRGTQSEKMRSVWVRLAPYAGKKLRLRAFDEASGSYGHIQLDQVALFRLRSSSSPSTTAQPK